MITMWFFYCVESHVSSNNLIEYSCKASFQYDFSPHVSSNLLIGQKSNCTECSCKASRQSELSCAFPDVLPLSKSSHIWYTCDAFPLQAFFQCVLSCVLSNYMIERKRSHTEDN